VAFYFINRSVFNFQVWKYTTNAHSIQLSTFFSMVLGYIIVVSFFLFVANYFFKTTARLELNL